MRRYIFAKQRCRTCWGFGKRLTVNGEWVTCERCKGTGEMDE